MSDIPFDDNAQNTGTIKCKNCGANLKFKPGTQSLSCDYCQTLNEIAAEKVEVIENDFNSFIDNAESKTEQQTISTVKCGGCGASTTLQPNVTSTNCPYCDTPLVIKDASTCSIIKPSYVLPFKTDRNKAKEGFISWVNGLWFAPSKLKLYARNSTERLKGVYMPYWTYDSNTESNYTGMRGDHYYVSESYTDSNGNRQTRSVQKTRWSAASGHVSNTFDDVLVCASKSLPEKLVNDLEPWDLPELVSYNDNFLAGFVTESYQINLKDGFGKAKVRMDEKIRSSVNSDIGGDAQQITTLSTDYNDIKFKHVLLPLWISAYKFNDKVYRFTVNARTGEVQGERPYSAIKIALFVISIIAVIVGAIYLFRDKG
jgi:LSD1 subclass zinc finger protein